MAMKKSIILLAAAALLATACGDPLGDVIDNTMVVAGNTYTYVLPLYWVENGYAHVDVNHPGSGDSIHGFGGFSAEAIGRTINAASDSEADKALLMSFNFDGGGSYDMALVSGTQSIRRDGSTLIVQIDGRDTNGKRFYLNAYVYEEAEFLATHPGGVSASWRPGD